MTAGEPEALEGYLRKHGAPLASCVRTFIGWELYGVAVTELEGIKLSHVVCRVGRDVICIFGVREDEIKRGSVDDEERGIDVSSRVPLRTAGLRSLRPYVQSVG